MKRYNKVFVLLAVLVVISIATFALTQYEAHVEQIQNSDAIILEIPSDSVTALSWEYEEGSVLSFYKEGDGWLYNEDTAFPVSREKVEEILSHFAEFGVTFIIEDVEDPSLYGVDEPECTLHITAGETTYDIKLGDFSKMDEQRYVDIGDGNVYLVSTDPMDYVSSSLSDMILHDDTPGFETVWDITFAGSENYTITRVDESTDTYNSEDDIYFVDRDGETVPLDTDTVRQYTNTITSLDLLDYVTYNATEEELAAYGLDTPELSVTINYTYTAEDDDLKYDTCVIHLGRNAEEQAEYEKAVENGDATTSVTKYVRIGDSQIVYELDDVDYAILAAAGYDDLRHKEVFWADSDIITQIDVTLEGTDYSITSVLEDEVRTWYYPAHAADKDTEATESSEAEETEEDAEEEDTSISISTLQAALENLYADSFTDEAPTGKEEIRVTLHLENENFPTVEIVAYRYDGDYCLITVDGESVSLVDRSLVVDLIEAVNSIVL